MSKSVHPETQKVTRELAEIHSELKTDLSTLRSDMQKDMKDIKDSLNLLLEMKTSWEQSLTDCKNLCDTNTELHARVAKVENENKSLNTHVCQLEDKLLEGNVIFQGIPDLLWESTDMTKEKVLAAISHTIGGESQEEKMDQAQKIPIKDVT